MRNRFIKIDRATDAVWYYRAGVWLHPSKPEGAILCDDFFRKLAGGAPYNISAPEGVKVSIPDLIQISYGPHTWEDKFDILVEKWGWEHVQQEGCACSSWQLLHGNPDCSLHSTVKDVKLD